MVQLKQNDQHNEIQWNLCRSTPSGNWLNRVQPNQSITRGGRSRQVSLYFIMLIILVRSPFGNTIFRFVKICICHWIPCKLNLTGRKKSKQQWYAFFFKPAASLRTLSTRYTANINSRYTVFFPVNALILMATPFRPSHSSS